MYYINLENGEYLEFGNVTCLSKSDIEIDKILYDEICCHYTSGKFYTVKEFKEKYLG